MNNSNFRLRTILTGFLLLSASIDGSMAEVQDETSVLKPIGPSYFLQMSKEENVVFRGMVNNENSAGKNASAMMYPASGVVGFLAAIATHGVLVEVSKNNEKTKQQELADRVLEPYNESIAGFTNLELMQLGLGQLSGSGIKSLMSASREVGDAWIIESTPTFTMKQDHSALILENAVSIYSTQAKSDIKFKNIVRVVSNPRIALDPESTPTQPLENKLKQESASLFSHSLKIVLEEVTAEFKIDEAPQKTFHYLEGKSEKIERGQLISMHCNRAIIKTLRGWFMSIPLRPSANADTSQSCITQNLNTNS